MKRCPRCDRGCQNKFERVCAECARAELTDEQVAAELARLRIDPFSFAAAFADRAEADR